MEWTCEALIVLRKIYFSGKSVSFPLLQHFNTSSNVQKLHFGGNILYRLPNCIVILVRIFFYGCQFEFFSSIETQNCFQRNVPCYFYWLSQLWQLHKFLTSVHCLPICHRPLREVSSKLWMTICKSHLDKWRFMDCFPHETHYIFFEEPWYHLFSFGWKLPWTLSTPSPIFRCIRNIPYDGMYNMSKGKSKCMVSHQKLTVICCFFIPIAACVVFYALLSYTWCLLPYI